MPRKKPRSSVSTLHGVGPVSRGWLQSIGIVTRADLERVGAVEAYRLLKSAYPKRVSLNLLWGLQAVLLDIDWRDLPDELKNELKRQLERRDREASPAIEELPNLGKVSRQWLAEIGVHTRDDLERVGVVKAYLILKGIHGRVSLNWLYAMQGALLGIDFRDIPLELRAELRRQAGADR